MNRLAIFIIILCAIMFAGHAAAATWKCPPTPHDEIGPFYKPNAPLRSRIGSGYVLYGTVRSAATAWKPASRRPMPDVPPTFISWLT